MEIVSGTTQRSASIIIYRIPSENFVITSGEMSEVISEETPAEITMVLRSFWRSSKTYDKIFEFFLKKSWEELFENLFDKPQDNNLLVFSIRFFGKSSGGKHE